MKHIFISSDPSDRADALQLQQSIAAIDPDLKMTFWDKNPFTEQEYRKQARAFLETAHLFVLVHSADYLNLPDTRWEMDTAIEEHLRRNGALLIVVVQARHAVIPAVLRGFNMLPGIDEAVEGTLTAQQLVRSSRHIVDMLRKQGHKKDTGRTRAIPLTLPDLQERLLEMSHRHNLLDVLSLLQTLVADEHIARSVRQLRDDFIGADLKYGIQLVDYQRSVGQIKRTLETLIGALTDDHLLHNGWRVTFLELYRKSELHQTTAFFFPNDTIKIPETLNLPAAADGTEEHTGFLSYEQKLEFRRLLLLCQDALQLEKYPAAHHYCEQVRTSIDPQSAQLYEYLLVSFVKKEQPLTIVRRLLDGVSSGFNHVKLYSDRFNQYQHSHPAQCPSETGAHNQAVAVEELASALHFVYSNIENNAICDTGALAELRKTDQQTILKCLDAFNKIYHSLSPVTIFLDTLLIELAGGGKFNWIERIAISDDGYISFISNSTFDLKGKTDELLRMLEQADQQRVAPKQREMIREDLFWNLLNTCEQLAEQVIEERRVHHERTDLRRSVIRIIQAAVAGHYLLTRPGDVLEQEKSLLRLAIELLIPDLMKDGGRYDLPQEILLDWFTLGSEGQLILTETDYAYRDFDAMRLLKKIVEDHAGAENWPVIERNMHEVVWLKYIRQTEAIYAEVADGLQYSDFRRLDALEARKMLIECHRRRWICYLAFPESDQHFPDRMIQEPTGQGLLLWFVMGSEGVLNHPDASFFKFDSRTALQALIPHSTQWTEEKVTAAVVGNLHSKMILPAYQRLRSGVEADREQAATLLSAMMMAFKSHHLPDYLDTAYKEITEEIKFKWIEIDKYGKLCNFSTAFDAIGLLRQLTGVMPLRYPKYNAHRTIADQRWKEQLRRYENEISVLRHENRLAERRIVVDIIWRLKGVYLFFNDRKYLEIPMTELNDRGRIRWFNRFAGIFKTNQNHFENLIIGFDLKAERIEIQMYWDRLADQSPHL